MKTRNLVALCFILLKFQTIFGQKISATFLPPKNENVPDWFQFFYTDYTIEDIDVFEVDRKAIKYKSELKKNLKINLDNNNSTGEETEDSYLNFYKRWRKHYEKYINENGKIKITNDQNIEFYSPSKRAPGSSWSLVGPLETYWSGTNSKSPWQANIYCIDVSISNPSILFCGPETGGIYKSTDKGLNWTCITKNYNISTLTAIKIHPTNPDTIYAGRSNQLLFSFDGGITWNVKSMGWGDVHNIAYKPSNPSTILIATDNGLYKNISAGSAISQSASFNMNEISPSSSTWNRCNTGTVCNGTAGSNNYCHVYPFTVSTTGLYTLNMCTPGSNWDGHASLFQNSFNPANPCGTPANFLIADNDGNTGGNCENDSRLTANLITGITYYLVTTSSNSGVTGGFSWSFTGPTGATLTSTQNDYTSDATITSACYDVFFKTDIDTIVFCLAKSGTATQFWKSIDGGLTFANSSLGGWTTKGPAADGGGRMTISASNPNRIYAVVLGSAPSPAIPYVFKSNDAGVTWDTTCTGIASNLTGNTTMPLGMSNGQGYYDLDILANPLNPDEVIVGTTTAYKSVDGGFTFTRLGGYGGAFGIHPDIQEMVAVSGESWISTDGGVNYSNDFYTSTSNFSPRCNGIFSSDFWGFGLGWNEDIMGGGRYHNGNTFLSSSYTSGEAIRIGGGEAPTGYYMIGRPGYMSFSDYGGVIAPNTRNGNLGTFSYTKYPNEDGYGSDVSEVEFLPYCYNTMFVGQDSFLWKSINGGASWTKISSFQGRVKEFEISRSNPDVMYLATNTPTQLQKTTDGGLTWNIIPLPAGASANKVSLALSYTDENLLYMVSPNNSSNNRVFKTTNGGTSWSNLTTSSINGQSYTEILYHNGTDNGVYIFGKNGKVFYKSDSEPNWVSFSNELPVIFEPLAVKPFYKNGKIRMAGNHGIWEIPFYEDGVPMAQPTVDKLITNCPRDTFYFTDYSALDHSGANWSWSFPGAAYVSSTSDINPKVVFGSSGIKSFSLTVTNAFGSSSKTINGKIEITGNECNPDTIPGKALTLTNPGDYARQNSALNITTNNFSITTWIKPNGIQLTNAGIVFSGNGGATGINFRSGNQIGYHWADQSSTYSWAGGPTIPANEWSHVAMVVKDGPGTSDTCWIYLNGVPYFRVGTHNPITFSGTFEIGIDRSNTARNFIGDIDEVCIYNRALDRNEIRELMNLTKNNPNPSMMPTQDNTLLSYYQFNELSSSYPLDKASLRHLTLLGNASISQNSTAPVGGGTFHRKSISSGGLNNFSDAHLKLTFPNSGTFPNGDLVVTHLVVPPDQSCALITLPASNHGYWIIRNYGSNSSFSALTDITFDQIDGLTLDHVTSPNSIKLYKRNSNADGNTWLAPVDSSDMVTQSSGIGSVSFNTGLNLTSFSQFSLESSTPLLPLKLVEFNASLYQEKHALLNWESLFEINFDEFEIQHSIDGNEFQTIGKIKGNGNGSYQFIHYNLNNLTNYYRLKMVDLNGTYEFSPIRVVTIKDNISVSIFPNPNFDGWVSLNIQSKNAKDAIVDIIDMNGKKVNSLFIPSLNSNHHELFYVDLEPGEYQIVININREQKFNFKLVKI